MRAEPLEFPPLNMTLSRSWEWPRPPAAWTRSALEADMGTQPCRVETGDGETVAATLVDMDPLSAVLTYLPKGGRGPVTLAFSRLRRLTMTAPLLPAEARPDAPVERVPSPAEDRDYELASADPRLPPLTGRTLSQIEMCEGLYLFAPMGDERALQRVFVPRSAYSKVTFGQSIKEIAAGFWITDRAQLLEAIDLQEEKPVLPIGQSLLALGLITPTQLSRALAAKPPGVALGEMLVGKALISHADLWAALAHKMGYPLVDLSRLPLDPAASMKPLLQVTLKSGALPLMIDGRRLIVAVDRPGHAVRLRNLRATTQMKVVPVFATRLQLLAALERLAKMDVWSEHVPDALDFLHTNL